MHDDMFWAFRVYISLGWSFGEIDGFGEEDEVLPGWAELVTEKDQQEHHHEYHFQRWKDDAFAAHERVRLFLRFSRRLILHAHSIGLSLHLAGRCSAKVPTHVLLLLAITLLSFPPKSMQVQICPQVLFCSVDHNHNYNSNWSFPNVMLIINLQRRAILLPNRPNSGRLLHYWYLLQRCPTALGDHLHTDLPLPGNGRHSDCGIH